MNEINDWIVLLPPLGAGVLLGLLFFGGLWLTVTYATASKNPALWFFISIILRTAIVLTGFYLVAEGQFPRLVACLAGFILARFLSTRILKGPAWQLPLKKEDLHD